jgi:hypothetical protein
METGDQPDREAEKAETAASADTSPEKEPSMEIHPPHRPIHTKKDFFISLLAITVGILIALSLEGVIERNHHRALVHEARTNLAVEISTNRKTMETYLQDIQTREKELSMVVSTMRELQQKKDVPTNLEMSYTFHTFDSAAWHAATTSGAVTYMGYDELQHYTDIYDGQYAFQALQTDASRNVADLASTLQLMEPRRMSLLRKDLKAWPAERFEEIEQRAERELLTTQLLEAVAKSTLEAYRKISPQP